MLYQKHKVVSDEIPKSNPIKHPKLDSSDYFRSEAKFTSTWIKGPLHPYQVSVPDIKKHQEESVPDITKKQKEAGNKQSKKVIKKKWKRITPLQKPNITINERAWFWSVKVRPRSNYENQVLIRITPSPADFDEKVDP